MKIRKMFRPAALLAAAAILFGASGCADTSWSFKTDSKTLSNGQWIYFTLSAYSAAKNEISGTESEESSENSDITKATIDGKNAVEWMEEEAKKSAVAFLTVEKLAADNKITISENDDDYQAKIAPAEYSYNSAKAVYDKLGVSKESYLDIVVRTSLLSEKLFDALYEKGGTQEVKDDEIEKYFVDNYTDYYYISYNMKTTDESGNTVDIDDVTKDDVKQRFTNYVRMLNSGSTTTEVEETYKTDFAVENVYPSQNITNLEDSYLSDELKDAIKKLEAKKATFAELDDQYYLIYKGDINEDARNISDDGTSNMPSRKNLLYAMKTDDYKKYLEDQQAELKYEVNDSCISKYSIKRTIDIVNSK